MKVFSFGFAYVNRGETILGPQGPFPSLMFSTPDRLKCPAGNARVVQASDVDADADADVDVVIVLAAVTELPENTETPPTVCGGGRCR